MQFAALEWFPGTFLSILAMPPVRRTFVQASESTSTSAKHGDLGPERQIRFGSIMRDRKKKDSSWLKDAERPGTKTEVSLLQKQQDTKKQKWI